MFLSVVRLRLIYSPFYPRCENVLAPGNWLYKKLRAPARARPPPENKNHKDLK